MCVEQAVTMDNKARSNNFEAIKSGPVTNVNGGKVDNRKLIKDINVENKRYYRHRC